MDSELFGAESFDEEDSAYNGSRFAEVRDALFANPNKEVWGRRPTAFAHLRRYTLAGPRGVWSFGKHYLFEQAVAPAVDSHADLRWSPDRKGFRRLLHPNGVCLTGRWRNHRGDRVFRLPPKGQRGLLVGRYSTCCSETDGHTRSLALVGELFPTVDVNHPQLLRTAHFVT